MLTNVQILNRDNPSIPALNLPLFGAEEYPIRYIEGLNPAPSNIITSDYADIPGGRFQHAKSEVRNIVLTLGFRPSYRTVEDTIPRLRTRLYNWLTPGTRVRLVFSRVGFDDVQIYGYVETHESNIFGQEPASQVSILCPNPYFEDFDESMANLVINDPPVEINYLGTVPTGMRARARRWIGDYAGDFSIQTETPFGAVIDFRCDLKSPSSVIAIELSSVRGEKDVAYSSSGTASATNSLLGDIQSGSSWPVLYQGMNKINMVSGTAIGSFDIYYRNRYGGI